jgi:predicted deacetylase
VVYAFLVASVAVAVWATGIRGRDRRSVARAVLLAAVVASLLPGFASPRWTSSVAVPQFLSTGAYRQHLSPGEVVLVVAGPGVQLLWQAHADLYFRTAGWYRGFRPADYRDAGTALALGRGSTTVRERVVRSFLRDHRVTAILAAPGYQRAADRLASVLGAPEVEVGGVILIRVPPGPPAGAGG